MDIALSVEIIRRYYISAPIERVYETYTDPRILPAWWGRHNQVARVEKMEVKPGGSWRYILQEPNASELIFQGTYQEVVPYQRLVFTFEGEGSPGFSMLVIVTFEELHGKTQLTYKLFFRSEEDRDRIMIAGIEENIVESMRRFNELFRKNMGVKYDE